MLSKSSDRSDQGVVVKRFSISLLKILWRETFGFGIYTEIFPSLLDILGIYVIADEIEVIKGTSGVKTMNLWLSERAHYSARYDGRFPPRLADSDAGRWRRVIRNQVRRGLIAGSRKIRASIGGSFVYRVWFNGNYYFSFGIVWK